MSYFIGIGIISVIMLFLIGSAFLLVDEDDI
jgi:hypothetical protein